MLLLIPQRYEFSSKSQHKLKQELDNLRCCWYHKGTNFQANHNLRARISNARACCCWYHKGTNFQANHNWRSERIAFCSVVADTTKVRIFKQITTWGVKEWKGLKLLLIPQRYEFSSKSQPLPILLTKLLGCCWYHKGTNFQANHNPDITR